MTFRQQLIDLGTESDVLTWAGCRDLRQFWSDRTLVPLKEIDRALDALTVTP